MKLIGDLVDVSNEQVKFILDEVQDFLPIDDKYVPKEKEVEHFVEWNPVVAITNENLDAMISLIPDPKISRLDTLLRKLAKEDLPSVDNILPNISPNTKGIWKMLMKDEKFVADLRKRPPEKQWSIAKYVFILRTLKHGKTPFVDWNPAKQKQFDSLVEKIHRQLKAKKN